MYTYDHFERSLLGRDMTFRAGPRPGDAMPDFDLPTTDGGRIRKSDFVGFRPLVLMFGSISCPMTAAAAPRLSKIYDELGDRVEIALVYVREAHPGERWRQPRSFDEKLAHARALKLRDRVLFPIAIDDVEGTFHRALDPKPNAVYVMDTDGNVAFRSLWASDERALRHAIERVIDHHATKQKLGHVLPILRGIGKMAETVDAAGPTAKRDLRREAPPLYALARLASVFKPLPPLGRSLAALATVTLGAVALGTLGARLAHR